MASRALAPARATPRLVTDFEASWNAQGERGTALVYNISMGGCMIEAADGRLFAGDRLALTMPKIPSIDGSVVWQDRGCAGVRFHLQLDEVIVNEIGFIEP